MLHEHASHTSYTRADLWVMNEWESDGNRAKLFPCSGYRELFSIHFNWHCWCFCFFFLCEWQTVVIYATAFRESISFRQTWYCIMNEQLIYSNLLFVCSFVFICIIFKSLHCNFRTYSRLIVDFWIKRSFASSKWDEQSACFIAAIYFHCVCCMVGLSDA